MAVYDYTYKTWSGKLHGALLRWLTIPKFTYLEFLSKKTFIWLFSMAWFPFLLFVAYIYITLNIRLMSEYIPLLNRIPPNLLKPAEANFFKSFIDIQIVNCFVFVFMMGTGLISKDLKNRAIVLIVSKPINRWEYFLGKFSSLFALVFLFVGVQPQLLFGLQYILSEADSNWRVRFWDDYAWISHSILVYSLIVSLMMCILVLAASCLSKNSRYAGMTFFIYIVGTIISSTILAGMIEKDFPFVISPWHSCRALGSHLFPRGAETMKDNLYLMPLWLVWSGIGIQLALGSAIIWWRLRRAARQVN